MVPKALAIQTPAQYGAVAPPGNRWPLNAGYEWLVAINKIYPTVQGEGAQAGTPMTIVRLQGCPVGCVFCDTPESWKPSQLDPGTAISTAEGNVSIPEGIWWQTETVAGRVDSLPPRWALITGGEPTWHYLSYLTSYLHRRKLKTALETAGVYPITGTWDWICISPKPAGLLRIKPENLIWANEIKWLVGREVDVLALQGFMRYPPGQLRNDVVVSLQPISCSAKATDICLEALMQNPEWRLSLQQHKYLGVA